ncbi:MAG: hypothetical protein QOD90_2259, partial [Mycobacterium sp.]|nr:hypothetical protein [Mycobacterium sp.]
MTMTEPDVQASTSFDDDVAAT